MKHAHATVGALAVAFLIAVVPAQASPRTPADVFAQLKMMEGSWSATAEQTAGEKHDAEAPMEGSIHAFSVSGAGSVVMEVMGAGSAHEMINMYHMDGDDLVLTHYCAAGNQPTMKLDRAMLDEGKAHFAFTGGTNIDEGDIHIDSATFDWREDGSVVADWGSAGGEGEAAVMEFVLTRAE